MRHDSEGVLTMASSGKPEESAQPSLSRTALVEINARHFHYNRYAHDSIGPCAAADLGECRAGEGLPVLHLHGESAAGTAPLNHCSRSVARHGVLRRLSWECGREETEA